jgi:hypothetical protein
MRGPLTPVRPRAQRAADLLFAGGGRDGCGARRCAPPGAEAPLHMRGRPRCCARRQTVHCMGLRCSLAGSKAACARCGAQQSPGARAPRGRMDAWPRAPQRRAGSLRARQAAACARPTLRRRSRASRRPSRADGRPSSRRRPGTTSAAWRPSRRACARRWSGRSHTRARSRAWAWRRRAACCCTGRPAAARRRSRAPRPPPRARGCRRAPAGPLARAAARAWGRGVPGLHAEGGVRARTPTRWEEEGRCLSHEGSPQSQEAPWCLRVRFRSPLSANHTQALSASVEARQRAAQRRPRRVSGTDRSSCAPHRRWVGRASRRPDDVRPHAPQVLGKPA